VMRPSGLKTRLKTLCSIPEAKIVHHAKFFQQ
jgi:hypothetical protein